VSVKDGVQIVELFFGGYTFAGIEATVFAFADVAIFVVWSLALFGYSHESVAWSLLASFIFRTKPCEIDNLPSL
jgi:hypothetical protein